MGRSEVSAGPVADQNASWSRRINLGAWPARAQPSKAESASLVECADANHRFQVFASWRGAAGSALGVEHGRAVSRNRDFGVADGGRVMTVHAVGAGAAPGSV